MSTDISDQNRTVVQMVVTNSIRSTTSHQPEHRGTCASNYHAGTSWTSAISRFPSWRS